ncbi:MAG: sensor domain-containing diguanylate cyclase [Nitrospirota bacterium]
MSEVVLKNRLKSLEQRLLQKGRELSLLKEMSLFLTTSVEKTLDLFAYRMGVLTSAKFVRVYLIDKTSTKLRLVSGYNLSGKYLDMVKNKFEVSIESVPCGKAVIDKVPYMVNDVNRDEVFSIWRDITTMLGYSSYVAMPLFVSDGILGAVDIFFENVKYFSDDEINLMSVLSNAGALAIENAMLIEKIANISVVDEDSGAFNYRHFNETLKKEMDRAKRYNQPLTLIMMNITGESPINDEALRLFVSDVKSKVRGSDMLFKYSDNTFCLILTQTPKSFSEVVISRLHGSFNSIFGEGWDLRIGVSCMPDDGDDAEILLKQASEHFD